MFKVAGPLWAQHATIGGDNVFARLLKTGKKVLRRFLQKQKEVDSTTARDFPKPTWSLQAQNVKVDASTSGRLIGGLFPKLLLKTQAAEARRQAALRLIRDARKVPVFAFVALSLGASLESKKGETEDHDVLFSGIRSLFQQHGGKENSVVKCGQHFSLQTLQLGQLIGQGCNAAVFEARPSDVPLDSSSCESSTSCVAENPPSLFHTDDHALSLNQSDADQDDFSIISDDEEEGTCSQSNLDGWVLYRLASSGEALSSSDPDEVSDSDGDIFILAGDEEGLESMPDLEDLNLECGWSLIESLPPDLETDSETSLDAQSMSGTETASTTVSQSSNLSSDISDTTTTSVSSVDPEPAPNIEDTGAVRGDYPLAVKMMYNYSVESHSDRILAAMDRETIPAQSHLPESSPLRGSNAEGKPRLPPHPNIVTMHGVFVDQTPNLPEGADMYPSALPPRLNKEGGFGRNATMFLVMKKYNLTLNEYLSTHRVDTHTRCLLFAQLLEGVAHLSSHGISHRDLKSNNILIDLSRGPDLPFLAISDFGSCLADTHYCLQLPYLTMDTDRGGNSALMAPEIKCATPGPSSILDYSKADIWAAGTLAHEIFNECNPFYSGFDSRSYCEDELPKLADGTPDTVVRLVGMMLKRNPSERPSPAVAATAMQLFMWAPPQMHPLTNQHLIESNALWRCKEVCHWLEQLTMVTVCQRVFGEGISLLDLQAKSTFLSRVSRQDIFDVVSNEG